MTTEFAQAGIVAWTVCKPCGFDTVQSPKMLLAKPMVWRSRVAGFFGTSKGVGPGFAVGSSENNAQFSVIA